MTQTISIFTPIDQEAERKRALAKVYSLLVRLAEEVENSITLPEIVSVEEEKIEELDPIQAGLINQEVCEYCDPELSTPRKKTTNNFVLLKNNIPS